MSLDALTVPQSVGCGTRSVAHRLAPACAKKSLCTPYKTGVFILLLLAMCPALAKERISSAAVEFIATGAHKALQGCDFPHRTCKGSALLAKSIRSGESNDQKRSVEEFAMDGMKATVIFSGADRSNFHLGAVEIADSGWPGVQGIKVGTKQDVVKRVLGSPNNGTRRACDSYVDEVKQSEAKVCYRAGKVASVSWEYFVD